MGLARSRMLGQGQGRGPGISKAGPWNPTCCRQYSKLHHLTDTHTGTDPCELMSSRHRTTQWCVLMKRRQSSFTASPTHTGTDPRVVAEPLGS